MAQKEYISGKENPFADFLSQKYEVDQTDNNKPTTSSQNNSTDIVNVVQTRAKSRQKLAPPPQNDLEVPETREGERIIDPSDLLNQDQWPFTQQQIVDAQKINPTLDQMPQKVENQDYFTKYVEAALIPDTSAASIVDTFVRLDINQKQITRFLHFDRYFERTFNCMVSAVYIPIQLVDSMVPEAVHLEESDVDIEIAIQLKADQETKDEALREYARRQHKLQVAQGTAPALPSVPPKLQLDKFLETVVSQASSNEYILGTELTSQDKYGQETTTTGSETTEQQIMLTQPKPELATKLTRLKNPQWLLWKKRQHCRKQLQFRKQLQQVKKARKVIM
uniref:Uncharacterized protein n=1 Tax=Romanomermis culicivorax TaxID=13658 RepID=A0A915JUR2_ROMCU